MKKRPAKVRRSRSHGDGRVLKESSVNAQSSQRGDMVHLAGMYKKVTNLQSQLSTSKQANSALQGKVTELENDVKRLSDENEQLKYEISELQRCDQEDIDVPIIDDEDDDLNLLEEVDVLRREHSMKEFEIRDLRENLTMQKYISNHIALSGSKPPVSSYAQSVCSTTSTISVLQKKYERSVEFDSKRGLELPIKLFDCRLDDDGSNVEIDIVKLPCSQEVRLRVKTAENCEDLDIRDVYANVVSEYLFHLETFDNGYYLASRQNHISVQEIVEDINAFQSFGRLPDRTSGIR